MDLKTKKAVYGGNAPKMRRRTGGRNMNKTVESMRKATIEAIRNKRQIPDPLYSLKTIFEQNDMPLGYLSMCEDRIVEEVGIDGEDVVLMANKGVTELRLSFFGLLECRNILENYIHPDYLNSLAKYAKISLEATRTRNDFLEVLQNTDIKTIKECLSAPELQSGKAYFQEELKCRKLIYKVVNKTIDKAKRIKRLYENRDIIWAVRKVAKKVVSDYGA